MKKIRLILSAILIITTFIFFACTHSTSDNSNNTSENSTENSSTDTDGIHRAKGEVMQIGDIILNDGSFLSNVTKISDAHKAKAIAIIYKVDGPKAWGVGLVHNKRGLEWSCTNESIRNFTDLQCQISGNAGKLNFSGDTDGSDNFSKIAKSFEKNDDDASFTGWFPAFEFAKKYKNQQNSHVSGTEYENDWYLPTMAELFDIWKVKATVDAASSLCGGDLFGDDRYWSSSQLASDESDYAPFFIFESGDWNSGYKFDNECVCCIRVFKPI